MPHNDSIAVLFSEKLKLEVERDAMLERLNSQIKGIEASIEVLSGKKVWEVAAETKFDDENPDYIKGSIED